MSDIEVVQSTLAEFDKVAAGLATLKGQYGGMVYAVETGAGMREAMEARAAIRAPRFDIEKLRKAAKAPLLAIGRKIDGEAARITGELEAIEGPIDAQIKAEDARKEAEKAAKAAAEAARLQAIADAIAAIKGRPVSLARASAAHLLNKIAELEALPITQDQFAHRFAEAVEAKSAAPADLNSMREIAVTAEAKAAQEAVERAEREAAQKIEAERLAAERKAMESERAELAAQRQAQEAEAARIRDAAAAVESARIAQEGAAADNERIAAQRAERERQAEAEAARKTAERMERESQRPEPEDMACIVADHYRVSYECAEGWLRAAFGGAA